MDQSKRHIKIAGAGISGLTSAIGLAQRGFPVEVYEKRNQVGGRFKGDLQGLENWTSHRDVIDEIHHMRLGIDLKYKPLPPLYLLVNSKHVYPIETTKPLCYLVKRGTDEDALDQILYRRALQLDIPVHLKRRIDPQQADIIATGPNSTKIFATDLGIKFETEHPDIAVAFVDDRAAYKGYSYLLISDGYGCLCNVLFSKFHLVRKQLEYSKRIILQHFPIKMTQVEEVGGVGSFAMSDHFKYAQMHVGEAAGIQDFLFGFGIRSAMRSGMLAAECLAEDRDFRMEAKSIFLPFQKAGLVNRFLFERFGNFYSGYGIMANWVRKHKNPNQIMHKAYQFTAIHRILFPLVKYLIRNRYSGIL